MSAVAPTSTIQIQDESSCDAQCTSDKEALEQKYNEQTKDLEQPLESVRQSGATVTGVPIASTATPAQQKNEGLIIGGVVVGFVLLIAAVVIVMRRSVVR